MRSYESAVTIDAPPEAVWAVLADVRAWPEWDSGVLRVEGTPAPGEKVKLVSEASPDRAFPVTVAEMSPPRLLRFEGGMPLGLFRGVRTYAVVPDGAGTRFTMREEYSGPLVPLIWRTMPDLQPSFDTFTAGLKARAEA